jgi:hypothetical protein
MAKGNQSIADMHSNFLAQLDASRVTALAAILRATGRYGAEAGEVAADALAAEMVAMTIPAPVYYVRTVTDEGGCIETDYDSRGDCDGDLLLVRFLEIHTGAARGDLGHMCGSHAKQSVRRHEAVIEKVITST